MNTLRVKNSHNQNNNEIDCNENIESSLTVLEKKKIV
jgi:hypothetical protein